MEIVLPSSGEKFSCEAFVLPVKNNTPEGFQAHLRFDSWLEDSLNSSDQDYLDFEQVRTNAAKSLDFVTLLQGEHIYRRLAEFIPERSMRWDLCTATNDLAFYSKTDIISKELLKAILESKDFNLGFMRRGSAFRALHRGPRHIMGDHIPTLKDARNDFSFHSALSGFEGDGHSLNVEFQQNNLIEDRVHCLIGKNGCGKTRLLHEFVLEMGRRAHLDDNAHIFLDNANSTAREPVHYEGPPYRRVLCFSFDSESRFPSGTRNDSAFEYVYTNLHSRGSDITEGLTTSSENLTRLLVDIFRSSEAIDPDGSSTTKTRWQLFRAALAPHIDFSRLSVPTEVDGMRGWKTVDSLRYTGEQAQLENLATVDFTQDISFRDEQGREFPLSSGHRVFLKFAISLLSYIDVGTLVIIDEPETHLHPNLVCDFMNLLYSVLQPTKSVALVATHSAYVIREVPTHCAHVYRIDSDGAPSESKVFLRTLGANIENISQAVFADSNAKKFHMNIARSMAKEQKTIEELVEEYSNIASPELLSQVAQMMREPSSPFLQAGEDDEE